MGGIVTFCPVGQGRRWHIIYDKYETYCGRDFFFEELLFDGEIDKTENVCKDCLRRYKNEKEKEK